MIEIKKISLGATSAIVTSMGLIAGLAHGSNAKTAILGGLLVVGIADNISDSLGIHIYKESEGVNKQEIKSSTLGNFIVRLIITLLFVIIVLLFPPNVAYIVSSILGMVLLSIMSYLIARIKMTHPLREVIYHLAIALLVIIGCNLVGNFISHHIAG